MISELITSIVPIVLNGNDAHHPMDGTGMMGGWWFWPILLIVAVIVVGVLIYLLTVSDEGNRRKRHESEKSAEKLLDERYARGEITKEEYEEKKEEIRK